MWLKKHGFHQAKQAWVFSLGLVCAMSAQAELHVKDAWVRGTISQQKATAAFMNLNSSQAMRLVGVSSDVAEKTEVHEMRREGDVMKMRAVDGLDLPAGQDVALTPGGYHIMLMGLKAPLAEGQTVTLQLQLQTVPAGQRVTQQVQAQVRPLTAQGTGHGHGHGSAEGAGRKH